MSDYERGKYYGKKKYNAQRADRSEQKSPYGSRFFNKTVYNPDKDTREPESEAKVKVKQPQILIKTREKTEERSVSPKRSSKENEPAGGGHKETASGNSGEAPATQNVRTMSRSIKLLEDGTLHNENVQDYLNDTSEFLVVGIIGPQGCGKSTIMNLLATDNVAQNFKKLLLKPRMEDDDDGIKLLSENMSKLGHEECSKEIFRQQSVDDVESCINTTKGIDMFVTENRVILLDCQPYSLHIDDSMRNELKRTTMISDFPLLENIGELQGLQHIAFLMSVCHVLILVQDFFLDSNNIRFLQTAEMLKPTTSNNEEEYMEQFPHLLIVHNNAQMEDFTPHRFKLMQQVYRQLFIGSKMHLDSSMGLGTGKIIPSLNPDICGEPINLFLLPEYDETAEAMYKGRPPFEELVKKLKTNVNCVTKYAITHVQLTEKTWLVHCAKAWEHIKKSSFYVEYSKLMP